MLIDCNYIFGLYIYKCFYNCCEGGVTAQVWRWLSQWSLSSHEENKRQSWPWCRNDTDDEELIRSYMRMMNQLAKALRSHHLSRVIGVEPGVVGTGGGALAEVLAVALAPE